VIVLDWSTKLSVGSYAGMQCKAQPWLAALERAVNRQLPTGGRGPGPARVSDNGCQPTSTTSMRARGALEVQPALTSDHTPKGKTDTEQVMRTLNEGLWQPEWTRPVT
jgi:putative transposase